MQPTCLVVSDSCCSILSTTFLKGGLLKGSASQQDLIIWYLCNSIGKHKDLFFYRFIYPFSFFVCACCFPFSVPPWTCNMSSLGMLVKSQMQQNESRLPFTFNPSLLWSFCAHTHFTSTLLTHSILHFKCNSHFTGCELWSIHFVSFFYQFVELGVHRHTRIGTISYIQQGDSVTLAPLKNAQVARQTHTHTQWKNRHT